MSQTLLQRLEAKAKEFRKEHESEPKDMLSFDAIEFVYRIQAGIIHHGGNTERRKKMIDIFNSMPLPYRKHAYQNYEGDGLVTSREKYTLLMKEHD